MLCLCSIYLCFFFLLSKGQLDQFVVEEHATDGSSNTAETGPEQHNKVNFKSVFSLNYIHALLVVNVFLWNLVLT